MIGYNNSTAITDMGTSRAFIGSTNGMILSLPSNQVFSDESTFYNCNLEFCNPFLMILERGHLLHAQQLYLQIYLQRVLIFLNLKVNASKIVRRKKNKNRLVKILSRTTLTVAILFLFSGQVLASDFPNDPNQAAIQAKKRLFIKRVTLLSIAVLILGTAGYVFSSRSTPLFIRLSPLLKENVISPLVDVLEFVAVPNFLKIPFSIDITTLSARINEVCDFLALVDSNPAFVLKNHQYKALQMVSLMSDYIDSLTKLGRDNKFDFRANAGKMILVNEAFERICFKTRFLEAHCTRLQTERLMRMLVVLIAEQKQS